MLLNPSAPDKTDVRKRLAIAGLFYWEKAIDLHSFWLPTAPQA